jgi:hypothetical protein
LDKRRQNEATSKETLEELEKEEVVETEETDDEDGPSPDGAFDEPDELKDADPF